MTTQHATSFAKGLRLLTALADHGPMRVDTLSEQTGLPVSSVYRYARDLVAAGFLEAADGVYRPGERLAQIARVNDWTGQLSRYSRPVLAELVAEVGETAMVTVRVGHSALVVEQVESPHAIRLSFQRGTLRPLHAGASAKVLLAFASPHVVDEVLAQPLRQLTDRTPSVERLRRHLTQIRKERFALTRAEADPFAVGVSVPIWCGTAFVGGLSIAGPTQRIPRERTSGILNALRSGADQLQATLEAAAGIDNSAQHALNASPPSSARRPAS